MWQTPHNGTLNIRTSEVNETRTFRPFGNDSLLKHSYSRSGGIPKRTNIRSIVQPKLELYQILLRHLQSETVSSSTSSIALPLNTPNAEAGRHNRTTAQTNHLKAIFNFKKNRIINNNGKAKAQ